MFTGQFGANGMSEKNTFFILALIGGIQNQNESIFFIPVYSAVF